jgi:hypothetical protein
VTAGIGFSGHPGAPLPDYVVGPVLAAATEVKVAMSNGTVVRAATIAPPPGLAPSIKFYAAQVPCPAITASIVGLDDAGHVVARYHQPSLGQFEKRFHLSC